MIISLQFFIPTLLNSKKKIYFTVTLPEVNYNNETGIIVVHSENRKAFPVRTFPVSASFAIFEKLVKFIITKYPSLDIPPFFTIKLNLFFLI